MNLEEVVRYIKTFNKHFIYCLPLPSSQGITGIYTHHYFKDRLGIRLKWKTKLFFRPDDFDSVDTLFTVHKEKTIKLLGFEFISYTSNFKALAASEDAQQLFQNNVLHNRKKKSFSNDKYKMIENNPSRQINIPDTLFDMLIQEVQSTIDFENYYSETKKNERNE